MSELVRSVLQRIVDYRDGLGKARVFPEFDVPAALAALGGPVPEQPSDPRDVVDQLASAVGPALVAISGPRYFGFVVGGTPEAAMCADLLAVGWTSPPSTR